MNLLQLHADGRRLTADGFLLKVPEVVAPGVSGPRPPDDYTCAIELGHYYGLFGPLGAPEPATLSEEVLMGTPTIEYAYAEDGFTEEAGPWFSLADFQALINTIDPADYTSANGVLWMIRVTSPDGTAASAKITATYA
jgi:hypothetical protein